MFYFSCSRERTLLRFLCYLCTHSCLRVSILVYPFFFLMLVVVVVDLLGTCSVYLLVCICVSDFTLVPFAQLYCNENGNGFLKMFILKTGIMNLCSRRGVVSSVSAYWSQEPGFVSQVSHQNSNMKNISSASTSHQISGKNSESKIKLP